MAGGLQLGSQLADALLRVSDRLLTLGQSVSQLRRLKPVLADEGIQPPYLRLQGNNFGVSVSDDLVFAYDGRISRGDRLA